MRIDLKKLLFGKRLIVLIGVMLTMAAAPVGILTFNQYMNAEATSQGEQPLSDNELRELLLRLGNAADPDSTFLGMSALEQQTIVDAMSSIDIVAETTSGTSNGGDDGNALADGNETSSWHAQTVTGQFLGIELWSYRSRTKWWYDGEELTRDTHWTRDTSVDYPYWEFVSHVDEEESGGEGDWEHEDFTEGHFRWCPIGMGCPKNEYPSITKWQYGDGSRDTEWDD